MSESWLCICFGWKFAKTLKRYAFPPSLIHLYSKTDLNKLPNGRTCWLIICLRYKITFSALVLFVFVRFSRSANLLWHEPKMSSSRFSSSFIFSTELLEMTLLLHQMKDAQGCALYIFSFSSTRSRFTCVRWKNHLEII